MSMPMVPMERSAEERVASAVAFADAARCYWLGVFPGVCRERRRHRELARRIPNAAMRDTALTTLRYEWGNVEGAVAFSTFVPRARRRAATRAMACCQAVYNYADMLSERHPGPHPALNARRLHEALLVAVDLDAAHRDYYYEHCPSGGSADTDGDGGYLRALVDRCRAALAMLPAYRLVAAETRRAAERIVEFQAAHSGERDSDVAALEGWSRAHTPPGSDLRWWETAAAAGSSLGVYALIALAASISEEQLDRAEEQEVRVRTLAGAYYPWIGAFHSQLDSLVDIVQDRLTGQSSTMGRYDSPRQAAERMRQLAQRALAEARELPDARAHTFVLAAMASFYLTRPEAWTPQARPVAEAVIETLGSSIELPMGAELPMGVLRMRRYARLLSPAGGGLAAESRWRGQPREPDSVVPAGR